MSSDFPLQEQAKIAQAVARLNARKQNNKKKNLQALDQKLKRKK